MNWTPQQARDYMAKRLKDEQRTRTEIYGKNHNSPQGLPAAEPERASRCALDKATPRKEKGGNQPAPRFKITFIVRARRPMDYDNACIKYLQDCIVKSGIIPDDRWDVLQGQIISEKSDAANEGTTVIIESL